MLVEHWWNWPIEEANSKRVYKDWVKGIVFQTQVIFIWPTMFWEIEKKNYSLLRNSLICINAAIPEILIFVLWIVSKKSSAA
jgi:hypothetical protein